MLQGKFDYAEVTYYGKVREGYLVDVSNGVGTLVGLNSNTAFQIDAAQIRVIAPGKTSFPNNQEIDQEMCYFSAAPTS